MKLKTEDDIIIFLEQNIIRGDASNYTNHELVEYFKTRYDSNILEIDYSDYKNFYSITVNCIENLFKSRTINDRNELAVFLIQTINNHYLDFKFNTTIKWFYAAIIHSCFECLKEFEEYFRDAFCTFDKNLGKESAFCRFITVSKVENYCRCRCKDSRTWFKQVVLYDGETVEDHKSECKEMISELWELWSPKTTIINKNNSLNCFLYGKIKKGKSLYWTIRKLKKY